MKIVNWKPDYPSHCVAEFEEDEQKLIEKLFKKVKPGESIEGLKLVKKK